MENKEFKTGSVRSARVAGCKHEFPLRYDLLSPIAMRRIARTFGEGAVKYSDHNWRKGQPFSELVNHTLAHLFEFMSGDASEDHLAHAAWNLVALMHLEETMPEMNDLKIDDYQNKKIAN
jgi:hypothetical protein